MNPHVVVIGGGYAGVMAARTAADAHAEVTLLDTTGQHDFLPRLATVAAGVGPESDASAPLTDLLHRIDVRAVAAKAVEHHARRVTTAEGEVLSYDALVVTVGAQAQLPPLPGLAEHAWTLRSADDALRLRHRLVAAERVVIVGAGATGTQLAGELSATRPEIAITLVEMTDRILPSLAGAMSRRAHRILVDRGVTVRVGVTLSEIAADGARTDDGEDLQGLVVWTGGYATGSSGLLPDADTTDGRLVVDRCAMVPAHGRVLAAGDVAIHRGSDGAALPQTAQVAVRAGALAGANAVRMAEGRRPRPTTLSHIGWVLPLGDGRAVAQVGPVVLADAFTSRVAPLLHDVIDLRHLFTVGGLPAVVGHHQQPVGIPLR